MLGATVALAGCALPPGAESGRPAADPRPPPRPLETIVSYAESTLELSEDELLRERELTQASVAAARSPSIEDLRLALLFLGGESADRGEALEHLDRFLAHPDRAESEVGRFARVLRAMISEGIRSEAAAGEREARLTETRAALEEARTALARAHAALAAERGAREKLERQIEALKAIERSLPPRRTE
jgi:hypothetical protein